MLDELAGSPLEEKFRSAAEVPVASLPRPSRRRQDPGEWLADAIAPRYRALVLLATFGNMRWGELAGLRRRYLDLDGQRVRVVETVYEFGQLVKGTPRSAASKYSAGHPRNLSPARTCTCRHKP
jgi:hypothetical protein